MARAMTLVGMMAVILLGGCLDRPAAPNQEHPGEDPDNGQECQAPLSILARFVNYEQFQVNLTLFVLPNDADQEISYSVNMTPARHENGVVYPYRENFEIGPFAKGWHDARLEVTQPPEYPVQPGRFYIACDAVLKMEIDASGGYASVYQSTP